MNVKTNNGNTQNLVTAARRMLVTDTGETNE